MCPSSLMSSYALIRPIIARRGCARQPDAQRESQVALTQSRYQPQWSVHCGPVAVCGGFSCRCVVRPIWWSGLTLLLAVVVIFVVSQTVFMRGFARVETTEVEEQVKRARAAVSQNLAELSADVFSYSSWDDTVAFLKDKNQVYIDANLLDSSLHRVQGQHGHLRPERWDRRLGSRLRSQ